MMCAAACGARIEPSQFVLPRSIVVRLGPLKSVEFRIVAAGPGVPKAVSYIDPVQNFTFWPWSESVVPEMLMRAVDPDGTLMSISEAVESCESVTEKMFCEVSVPVRRSAP